MTARSWSPPPAGAPGATDATGGTGDRYDQDIISTPIDPQPTSAATDGDTPDDPATTRRPAGGTRRCPHCGPVLPVPHPTDPDDPAAPGDRCPACGYDWPGGAPCVG
jgi:hypothetical protein